MLEIVVDLIGRVFIVTELSPLSNCSEGWFVETLFGVHITHNQFLSSFFLNQYLNLSILIRTKCVSSTIICTCCTFRWYTYIHIYICSGIGYPLRLIPISIQARILVLHIVRIQNAIRSLEMKEEVLLIGSFFLVCMVLCVLRNNVFSIFGRPFCHDAT